MSAVLSTPPQPELVPMLPEHAQAVWCVEMSAYSHPWTRGNFLDSIQSGYWCQVLQLGEQVIGHVVAMPGVGEAHLLNITVAPEHQGRGLARFMLDALVRWSTEHAFDWVWLEVRDSNTRAQNLYRRYGFAQLGRRKDYYPAFTAERVPVREDAVVMSYKL